MTKSHIKVLRMIEEQAPHMLTFEDRMMLRRDEMNWGTASGIRGDASDISGDVSGIAEAMK